jgi:hypothetical protein
VDVAGRGGNQAGRDGQPLVRSLDEVSLARWKSITGSYSLSASRWETTWSGGAMWTRYGSVSERVSQEGRRLELANDLVQGVALIEQVG